MSARPHWLRGYRSERHAALDWPACNSGPCDQGRKVCPSPEACNLAEANVGYWLTLNDLAIAVVCVLGTAAILFFGG